MIPAVLSPLGIPVRPVTANAPAMRVSPNGLGIPIRISDLGAPFVVSGLVPATDFSRIAAFGSSTVEYFGPEMATELAPLGVTYFNGGDAGVRAEHTLAQLGSRPALLTVAGGTIPASGAVGVTVSNAPLTSFLRSFTGTLAGVEGTLSGTIDAFTFTRAAAGSAVSVPADTPFIPTVGPQYRSAVNLLNIGKNNAPTTPIAQVSQWTQEARDWIVAGGGLPVIMGHAMNRDTPDVSTTRTWILGINALLSGWAGADYFDLQGYMVSPQIWIDAGVTPTQEDLDAQARGNKPPSLSLDDIHFNNTGDAAVAKAFRRFVVARGWYVEPLPSNIAVDIGPAQLAGFTEGQTVSTLTAAGTGAERTRRFDSAPTGYSFPLFTQANGRPALFFDGIHQISNFGPSFSFVGTPTPQTVLISFRIPSYGTQQFAARLLSSGTNTATFVTLRPMNTVGEFSLSVGTSSVTLSSVAPAGTWAKMAIRFDGANSRWINSAGAAAAISLDAIPLNGLRLGGNASTLSGTSGLRGEISRFRVLTEALDDAALLAAWTAFT